MQYSDWIADVYLSKFGWEVLEDIALGGPRLGGSEGEHRAHERVQRAFREAGLRDVSEQQFEIPLWERGSAEISVDRRHTTALDCIALPKSPSRTVEAEFAYLEHGLPEDFERVDVDGKIAVVQSDVPSWYGRWLHRLEKYRLAIEHGAIGFVFANHVEGYLPATGAVGKTFDVIGEIPAVGVSKEVGENLRRICAAGPTHGQLEVDAVVSTGQSRNVFGFAGPETDREIVLGAHVDAHDIGQGANDNGTGVAIMCETAQAVAGLADQLETRIRFVGFGAEEHGMAGSTHYVANADPEATKLAINLDSLGKGRELRVHNNQFEGITESVEQLTDELAHPLDYRREYACYSDHWPFVAAGIPGIMVSAVSGHDGRGYVHTRADTLDKIDIRAVRDHAILVTRLVTLLARDEVEIPAKTQSQICDDLRELGEEEWLRLAGDWPGE